MLKQKHLFKRIAFFLLVASAVSIPQLLAAELGELKKHKMGLWSEMFDQNIFYEGTSYLNLDHLYSRVFGKKFRSTNINIYDEVPDSGFFTNRHAKKRLSQEDLAKGYSENSGPDTSSDLMITKGKFEGLHPGFFIKDSRGDRYLIKFDPVDNYEMATAAEVVASRFYHAIGYNVPQYTVATFSPEKLKPLHEATIYDDSGFLKTLTSERLEEYLLFLPQNYKGEYRVSASKFLAGESKGGFYFRSRRTNDPDDMFHHENRREIRALIVFGAWLNNYDTREGNSLDIIVEENGEQKLKHYLIDFNSAFGSGAEGPKPPMFSHENMMDYGEATKAFLTLGFWEKPWQRRWREAGEKVKTSPAVGYFDNNEFDPAKFKTQFPYMAFKKLTRADGFWAAKVIMKFTDDDIRAMVKTGQYSNSEDVDYLVKILSERRDIIGRYWFSQASPLDQFDLSGSSLQFKNLAIEYGFDISESTTYHVAVVGKKGSKKKEITSFTTQESSIAIDKAAFEQYDTLDFLIRTSRESSKLSPYVLVSVNAESILGIVHED